MHVESHPTTPPPRPIDGIDAPRSAPVRAPIATFTWDRLTATCATSFLLLVAGLSVGVVLGELRSQLHLSGVLAAAHGATFGVGLLVVGAFGLPLIERLGRHATFRLACAGIVTGVMLLCVGQVWPVTLTGTAISGTACATLVMLMPGILADHHGEGRAAAFAAVNGLPGLAGVSFALVVGGALGIGWSWRWPYALLTLALAAAVAVAGRGVHIPDGAGAPQRRTLALFADRDVLRPYLGIVHAVLVEFTVGVFSTVYLKESAHASGGLAAALGGLWGIALLCSRMWITRVIGFFGVWSRSAGFGVAACGVLTMWAARGPALCAVGLVVTGLGAGLLYPLAVEQLYERDAADTVSLGAVAALGSGTAVTVGPMLVGILSDTFSVRHAILFVPVLAVVGVILHAPRGSARRRTAVSSVEVSSVA